MPFLVEFDTLTGVAHCDDAKELQAFLDENLLNDAFLIAIGPEDLTFQLTTSEMHQLSTKLGGTVKHEDEDKAADYCMDMLANPKTESVPKFSKKVAKNLLKGGAGPETGVGADKPQPKPKATKKPASDKPAKSRASAKPDTLLRHGEAPKENTVLFLVWKVVSESKSGITSQEVVNALGLEFEERMTKRYIRRMLRQGNLVSADSSEDNFDELDDEL